MSARKGNRKGEETRRQILEFIEQYLRDNDGISPSYEEIAHALGTTSKSFVKFHLTRLREDGRIKYRDCLARTIRPVR